ncbi:hypothetical protein L1987_43756 [Smallanthus sonchifolius]|uniref:Uncharacterized protein n=1 Tax=Smallanthus sonchifolius TaxID=185202 RepID=A0ACB9GNL1_9ASTR|nr:hypothetical protein L1987_43756 [Smallanthus sonchifolius]
MNSPIPHLPLFFSMFFAIYFTAHFIVFRNWSSKLRPEAASCLISLAHGTPAVLLACQAIISDTTHGFASTNTDFQNSVLEYSIAYFLMDLCHYLIFNPSDVLFIGHHLATLFVFVTCRYLVVHGAYGILILLILAEVTSFFQNVWTLARALRAESKVAAQVFDVLSPPFYALYSVVRGLFGPLFVYKMVGFYLTGAADDVIPRWVWLSWICVVVAAISVSILWILVRWIELYRERIAVIEKERKIR